MLGRITSWFSSDRDCLVARGRHVTGPVTRVPLTPTPLTPTRGNGTSPRPRPTRDTPAHRHPYSRTHRRPYSRAAALRATSLVTTAGVALGLGAASATHSLAETPHTRAAYAPRVTTGWRNDVTLGRTARSDQYAEARISGLQDARYGAGFRLRYADRGSQVLVAVSGAGWLIQPSDGPGSAGTFPHTSAGTFRAEIEGRTVRLRWNGLLVATRVVNGTYLGRHVVTTVRQPAPSVVLRGIRASSLPATTPATTTATTTATTPATSRPAGVGPTGTWWSGAAGKDAAAGRYGVWRGSPLQIGGTWTDTFDAQTDQWMICGGPWKSWNAPLDLAVGAIFHDRGETWAAAARGAYTARWTTALDTIRNCWGSRDPSLLYLRFAHEMNLASVPWSVRKGEEADFVAAMRRFSDLRYRILPRAKLVFCPNDGTDSSLGGLDVRTLWPGKDSAGRPVASVFGVDSYNGWPHVTTAVAFATKINARYPNGAPRGIERYRQLAAGLGVPFAVPEWSNNGDPKSSGGGGESPAYVREFNAWARSHSGDPTDPRPGQLLYEVQFNLWTEYAFWPTTVQTLTAATYRSLPWGH